MLHDYFDDDSNGFLQQAEFINMWKSLAPVDKPTKRTKRLYFRMCKLVGGDPQEGLSVEGLHSLYVKRHADFDEHIAAFCRVRELPENRKLREELKSFTGRSYTPDRVAKIVHLYDGTCVVLSDEPNLYVLEDGALIECSVKVPTWIGNALPTFSKPALLALEDHEFKLLSFSNTEKRGPRVMAKPIGSFPETWVFNEQDESVCDEWDACVDTNGNLHIVAIVATNSKSKEKGFLPVVHSEHDDDDEDDDDDDDDEDDDEEGGEDMDEEAPPRVYPEPPRMRRLVLSCAGKSIEICRVPNRARLPCISSDGLWCAFQVLVGEVHEEANRGEWYVCRLEKGSKAQKVTEGLPIGRVSSKPACFAPNGGCFVYQANHDAKFPITKHMDLWLVRLQGGKATPPQRLTEGSMHIDAFTWAKYANPSEDALWLSTTHRHEVRSYILRISSSSLTEVKPAAAYGALPSWNPRTAKCVYPIENVAEYESIWDEKTRQAVGLRQWSRHVEDIKVEVVQWEGPGGAIVTGAVYYKEMACSDRALIVWAHGGPTISWPILRGNFSDLSRQNEPNFIALLRAGYLLFVPLYRGTMGFGDEWSMATIGHQGSRDGDLGDILTGVAHLRETRKLGFTGRAGIYGESYGGYLTIKALVDSEGSNVFQCGVTMYGFINNRAMSLESGDFTWENEFVGPSDEWPAPDRVEDTNSQLGSITRPLLIFHGAQDSECPVSQSMMVYRALRQQNVPTSLVVYDNEGHLFSGKKATRDRDWRVLQWFLKYLPCEKP
jgi:dienelactone hydrolase